MDVEKIYVSPVLYDDDEDSDGEIMEPGDEKDDDGEEEGKDKDDWDADWKEGE